MRWGLAVVVVMACTTVIVVSCKSADDCGQPDNTVFECAPQPLSVPGCVVGDASYPPGCEEIAAQCQPAYDGPLTCYCNADWRYPADAGAYLFVCPL